jgi:cytidine deaminase
VQRRERVSIGLTHLRRVRGGLGPASSGGGRIVALAVVAGDGEYLAPCGRCRQVLSEFADPDMVIDTGSGTVTLGELLPGAFGPADLAARRDDG